MIISASRRTDIPAYYADWFFDRLREGYVLIRNPINPRRIARVPLTPDVVDGIVFWTKNPLPLLDRLNEIKDYPYYFQFTLNPYGIEIEPGVPTKDKTIVPAFLRLSDRIGADRVLWRYDPILLSPTYSPQYHLESFARLAKCLAGYTHVCTFSFVDLYRHLGDTARNLGLLPISIPQMRDLAVGFSDIAQTYRIQLFTCAENLDLSQTGILPARCIDARLFEQMCGCHLNLKKDTNQRAECNCDASIDIGSYDSCVAGCRYCYANIHPDAAAGNRIKHDAHSPLLLGTIGPEDVVYDRPVHSCREDQLRLDI